jgi:response regulator RpfG family c-di-GMP phosphodiesterase
MNDLRNDSKRFFNTLAQFFSLVMLFILIPAAIWARKMINPINRMAETTGRFVFDNEKSMEENLSKIARLNIRTGDELENLYRSFVKMTGDSVRYIKDINQKNATIQKMHENLLVTIAELVENRDENTGQHIRKTAKYVSLILEEMRRRGVYADKLTDEYINSVVQAAPLHDVGKIHVPDMILNKPGKLTDEEFEVMKTHTTHGGKIIDTIIELMPESNYLAEAKNLAMYHHEKWNGKGYPRGLAGEDIPLSARVMAVADVFDALVSRRSYKEGFPYEKALGIIQQESGKHFDPQVVEAFMAVKDKALETADGFIARANAPFNTTPATSKA